MMRLSPVLLSAMLAAAVLIIAVVLHNARGILCAALGARYARYRAGRAERETELHHLRVT
jgi:hypothetical protein